MVPRSSSDPPSLASNVAKYFTVLGINFSPTHERGWILPVLFPTYLFKIMKHQRQFVPLWTPRLPPFAYTDYVGTT